jgi:uncharacterized protein YrrD
MADTDPIAYTALAKGTPVLSTSGTEFGKVEHVLADESLDLFDGIAIKDAEGYRFVDATQVASITEAAVHTTVTDDQVGALPKPDGNAVLEADPLEFDGNAISRWFGKMFFREHWTRERDDD